VAARARRSDDSRRCTATGKAEERRRAVLSERIDADLALPACRRHRGADQLVAAQRCASSFAASSCRPVRAGRRAERWRSTSRGEGDCPAARLSQSSLQRLQRAVLAADPASTSVDAAAPVQTVGRCWRSSPRWRISPGEPADRAVASAAHDRTAAESASRQYGRSLCGGWQGRMGKTALRCTSPTRSRSGSRRAAVSELGGTADSQPIPARCSAAAAALGVDAAYPAGSRTRGAVPRAAGRRRVCGTRQRGSEHRSAVAAGGRAARAVTSRSRLGGLRRHCGPRRARARPGGGLLAGLPARTG